MEFGQELSGDPKRCGRLEEALLEMGILDALVIEEQYRDQVMEADPGCADRYLFVQPHYAEKSLLDVLDLNDSVNDIFMNQRITGILGNIALSERPEEAEDAGSGGSAHTGSADIGTSMTAVRPDGSYQIGVVSGTISGEHEAGFIGVQAREKNRQAKIASCRELLAENEQRQEVLRGEVSALEQRIRRLQDEYESLPEDTDMREAWKMLSEARQTVERMREEGARLERELMEVGEALGEIKRQAAEIAQKLYLTCSYETFRRADEAASDYRQHFYQLRSGHELFLQIRAHIEELGERQEILDGEMDQIRYEAGSAGRELKKEQEEYDSILRQLELTDYEQIRQKLDECMEWLKEYPERLQS